MILLICVDFDLCLCGPKFEFHKGYGVRSLNKFIRKIQFKDGQDNPIQLVDDPEMDMNN